MALSTPIFDAVEQRLKERDEYLQKNGVKVEIRKPFEIRQSFFIAGINFETSKKLASFTVWERDIIQVEVLVLDLETKKSEIVSDGKVENQEAALKIFDELCGSLI